MVGGLTVSTVMKLRFISFVLTLGLSMAIAPSAFAQDEQIEIKPPQDLIVPDGETPKSPDGHTVFDNLSTHSELGDTGKEKTEEEAEADIIPEDLGSPQPDYSQLTPNAERQARLDEIFERLQAETNPEDADLIAEEVWALWLDSGSPSIDFVLRRGSAAHTRKDHKLARRMFDHVTELSPNYAEGWARSSRLALDEKDLGRALNEAAQALILEPRHFYALWTMGNVFEQLGRQDEALEAYREANKLYPELKAVKDRLGAMQSAIDGDVL